MDRGSQIVENRIAEKIYPPSAIRHPRSIGALFFVYGVLIFCGFSPISEIKNQKGNDFYKKGELGKARSQYQEAVKTDPRVTPAFYNLGNTYYREDSFESSSRAYEHAAEAEKDPLRKSGAYYNLGNSYYRQEQKEKAAEAWKNALRYNPADQDAKYNLELLRREEQKKKNDQKKDQKQQSPQDQKNQQGQAGQSQQNQGGGGGQKDQQGQSGGAGGQDQKGQDQSQSDQQAGPGKPDSQQGQNGAQGQDQGEQKNPSSGSGNEEQPSSGQKTGPPPAESASEIRAEQILAALENQEQQVLKLQGSQKNPRIQGRRVAEKDW